MLNLITRYVVATGGISAGTTNLGAPARSFYPV